jgi:hypothetical protein
MYCRNLSFNLGILKIMIIDHIFWSLEGPFVLKCVYILLSKGTSISKDTGNNRIFWKGKIFIRKLLHSSMVSQFGLFGCLRTVC